ncbi:unnamed protein product [Euphydryas editha]|uniref:Uncharacterized protein n=1 Tax=Euphydryas editha TaxID=104508 RepID=A0AAU9UI51_EUPED|nr:unnamed protein product [Euphydryas editha]
MRRNRGYNNPQPTSDGPLLTNHLRDLDIELELLQRKRDIIQQEQDILNRFSSKRQYDYGQSSKSYDREEPSNFQLNTNAYSNRYDGPSRSGNFTRPQAPKRPTHNQYWAPAATNKNFTTTPKINPWQTSIPKQNTGYSTQKKFHSQPAQPRHISSPIRPLMSIRPSISQKVQKKFSAPRKDFKPSKVSKPKPQQAPNKLATYSSDVTKNLVSKVFDTDIDKKADSSQILRADKSPTIQMTGRLELALGMIIKEIKSDHCTTPGDLEYFNASFIQRLIKHTIRTRIRNVMLDQVVGNINDIVTNYRKKYPKTTDIELVQIAKDAQGLSTNSIGLAQLIESDDPEEFYKKNMTKTLNVKLEEMFQNLEKLYMNKGKDLEELVKHMPEPKNIDNDQDKTENKTTDNLDTEKEKDNTENAKDEDVEMVEPIREKFSKIKYYKDFIDELIEARLPKILPKFKDILLSIMLMDREFLGKKALIATQFKKKFMKPSIQHNILDVEQSTNTNDTPVTSEAKGSSDQTTATESTPAISPEATKEPLKEATITSTPKKSQTKKSTVQPPKSSPLSTNVSSVTQNKVPEKDNVPVTTGSAELYYVKLISRPALPARAVIYDFLNQFKPSSIKKHKSINNLLVIGFKNIEDYNKILTVNESVVGNATIVIKASEQQVSKPKQPTISQNESSENESKTPNESLDSSLINTELDSQITDLLTTIRKAEELQKSESTDTIDEDNKMGTSEIPKDVTTDSNNDNDKTDQTTNTHLTKTVENINTGNGESNENEELNKETQNADATDIKNIQNTNLDIDNNKNNDNPKEDENQRELETITEVTEKNESETDKDFKPDDKIKENLKESGRSTPTRSSSRLTNVTPSTIRTRRASRLAQNN